MSKIYVFGVTPFAEMLRYYVEETGRDVFGGYVVDEEYMPENGQLGGGNVTPWDQFVETVDPESCKILLSVTYGEMNKAREKVFHRIKDAGYHFAIFIHPSAAVATNCELGEGNIILEHATIQPFTRIGGNNVFWSNVNICHHTEIGDYNFFAASSVVLGKVVIKDRCFIGSNATVKNGITVESDTLIGAAAYLARDTEKEQVIVPTRSIILDKKSGDMRI